MTEPTKIPANVNGTKITSIHPFTKYAILRDVFLVLLLCAFAWFGKQLYESNHNKIISFERSLNRMGTGISLDNQRKAKIAKANEMILSRNPKLPYEVSMNYAEWFVDESDRYTDVDFVLLISIASYESAFNYNAQNPTSKARGLMQMMPLTAMDMCEYLRMTYSDSVLFDPKTSIRLGARYVHQLMVRFNNEEHVIAAYNAGERGAVNYISFKAGIVGKEAVAEENLAYVPIVLKYKEQYDTLIK
jgi:soluble lytic murein transglycosylase-like protein